MSSENQELRKAGLKVTLPRVKILQLLENSETRHLSAEDVYKALIDQGEEVGLATVYRVLTQFESAGLVMRHRFEGDFEPGEDAAWYSISQDSEDNTQTSIRHRQLC